MKVTLDASVVLKWLLADDEPDRERALELFAALKERQLEVVQPVHWLLEVAAVLARAVPTSASTGVELLYALELPVAADVTLLRLATDLAIELDHHLFDTLYHAVAIAHGATLITADRRYFAKARGHGSIAPLDAWPATQPTQES